MTDSTMPEEVRKKCVDIADDDIIREFERYNFIHVNDTQEPIGELSTSFCNAVVKLALRSREMREELALARRRLGPAGYIILEEHAKMQKEIEHLEAYKKSVAYAPCPQCGYVGCVRGRMACDAEIDGLKAKLDLSEKKLRKALLYLEEITIHKNQWNETSTAAAKAKAAIFQISTMGTEGEK